MGVYSGENQFRSTVSGKGSVTGNGAVGTAITLQRTLTGSDGKLMPYTWVLNTTTATLVDRRQKRRTVRPSRDSDDRRFEC